MGSDELKKKFSRSFECLLRFFGVLLQQLFSFFSSIIKYGCVLFAADCAKTKFHQRAFDETAPIAFPGIDISKYKIELDENEIKRLHLLMLLQFPELIPLLVDKYWLYDINIHDAPLITSDTPITLISNPANALVSSNGLASKGVHIVFPLSPNIAVSLYDKSFFPEHKDSDKQLGFLTKGKVVRPPESGHMNFYDASVRDQYSSSTSAGVL